MEDSLRTVTSDFKDIATCSGFQFNQYSGSVDWENLDATTVADIVENVEVNRLSTLVASVLSYDTEKMSVSKKIFRLSQLIIDFLLHCKRHSTFKSVCKADSMVLCELCGKMYMDVNFLKYHCFRRHTLNSCTYDNSMSLPEDNRVESLKSEVLRLQKQLEKARHNNLQISTTHIEKQNLYDCHDVHKSKLSYNLVSQQGDNPMQTQEMFWRQKYDSLEKNYTTLKNECALHLKSTKNTTDFNQQCDFYKTDKSSKYVQTEYLVAKNTTPERPPRNIDEHRDKEVYSTSTPNSVKTNFSCLKHCSDGSSDRDIYELKKLRLEAQNNISKNNIIDDSYEPLLSCDHEGSFKIVLKLGNASREDELFKNTHLLDLIKLDVKELINQRLEEYYSFKDTDLKKDISLKKISYENQECPLNTVYKNEEISQDISPEIEYDKASVKQNKTFMSRLKKKVSRFSRGFTSD